MKTLFAVASLAVLVLAPALPAEEPALAALPAADDLEILVAPIALYPDPLIALILPASTRPAEIVLAARFLDRGGNAEAAQQEPWDDAVRALTRYREVIEYLDRQLDWTRRLGEAFTDRPDDVMDAIQSARTRARAQGLLPDTPQQTVIVATDAIRIVPTTPTVIYVPRYDPEIIYVTRRANFYPSAWLSFGLGYGVGAWLSYDCDWRYRSVRIMHRPSTWYYQPDWHRHRPEPTAWTRWSPRPRRERDRSHAPTSPAASSDFPRRAPLDRRRDSAGPADSPQFNQPVAPPRSDEPNRSRPADGPRDRDRHHSADRERAPGFDRHSPRPAPPSAPAVPRAAPALVATPPPAPTAPEIVSQPPGAHFNSPPPTGNQPRAPRDRSGEREHRTNAPRRDNAEPAERTAPAPRNPSDSRAERAERGDRRPTHESER